MKQGTIKQALTFTVIFGAAAGCSSAPKAAVPPPISYQQPTQVQYVPTAFSEPQSTAQNASLWETSPDALLSMRRAKDIGDLLTVLVEMDDEASLQNSLSRNRTSTDELSIGALFGLNSVADTVLPGSGTLNPAMNIDRGSTLNGGGSVNRAEKIEFKLACRVVGIEPSGNLIIQGYQQIRVSNEVRYLEVSGVIRAQDITRSNTVSYDQIADARLTYVSSGEATAPVQRKAGVRLLDKVLPF